MILCAINIVPMIRPGDWWKKWCAAQKCQQRSQGWHYWSVLKVGVWLRESMWCPGSRKAVVKRASLFPSRLPTSLRSTDLPFQTFRRNITTDLLQFQDHTNAWSRYATPRGADVTISVNLAANINIPNYLFTCAITFTESNTLKGLNLKSNWHQILTFMCQFYHVNNNIK